MIYLCSDLYTYLPQQNHFNNTASQHNHISTYYKIYPTYTKHLHNEQQHEQYGGPLQV